VSGTIGQPDASGFSISDLGTNKSITIPSPAGNIFFRLKNP